MPIEYVINTQFKVIVSRFRGTVGFREIADHAAHLRQDCEFRPEYCHIVDLSEADSLLLDFTEASIVAGYIDPFLPDSRRAIVATTPVNTGVARMHQMLRHDLTSCQVFKSFEEAWEWGVRKPVPARKPPSRQGTTADRVAEF